MTSRIKAFKFWYKVSELAPTEYIYVVAVSKKQAVYYFNSYGYSKNYDYAIWPIDVRNLTRRYEVGDVLGCYATL